MRLNELSQYIAKRIMLEWGGRNYTPDISEIGSFEFRCYNDPDDYQQYLEDNELQDSDEVRRQYFMDDNVSVDMYFNDHEYDHFMAEASMYYSDIVDTYGQTLADYVLNACYNKEDGEGRIEKCMVADQSVDLSDPDAVNAYVQKFMPTGEYTKGARGFILSNGVMVFTEQEHNEILQVPGIESKFQFIEMGNIRVLPSSIDLGDHPTMAQIRMLRRIIGEYENDDEFYVDCMGGPHSSSSAKYEYPDPDEVIGEICRYYRDGINLMGGHGGRW